MPKSAARILVLLLSAFGAAYTDAQTSSPQPVVFRIQAASSLGGVSGRLIVFLKQGKGDTEEFHPENTYVFHGLEVSAYRCKSMIIKRMAA